LTRLVFTIGGRVVATGVFDRSCELTCPWDFPTCIPEAAPLSGRRSSRTIKRLDRHPEQDRFPNPSHVVLPLNAATKGFVRRGLGVARL